MKRKLKTVILTIIVALISLNNIKALENEKYYLPQRNTYYTRSQHTYSYYENEENHDDQYVPAIYTLVKDLDEAKTRNFWNFSDKYSVPWNINDNTYNIAYCADLLQKIIEEEPYKKIPISNSTYVNSNIKNNLVGIIKNSYPYITIEEMQSNLLNSGILEYKEINNEKIITTKNNDKATRNITTDEIISAIQMAIYHFTNPNIVEKKYFSTNVLTARTVLRLNGNWKNTYLESGFYDEVDYNINTIYNYLITLKEEPRKETKIINVETDNNNLYIQTNNKISKESELKLEIYNDENILNSIPLKNLESSEKGYILNKSNLQKNEKVKLKLTGKEFIEKEVFIYEGENGKQSTQTLIGSSSDYINLNTETPFNEISINPSTGIVNFKTIGIISLLLCITILIIISKKKAFIKL